METEISLAAGSYRSRAQGLLKSRHRSSSMAREAAGRLGRRNSKLQRIPALFDARTGIDQMRHELLAKAVFPLSGSGSVADPTSHEQSFVSIRTVESEIDPFGRKLLKYLVTILT